MKLILTSSFIRSYDNLSEADKIKTRDFLQTLVGNSKPAGAQAEAFWGGTAGEMQSARVSMDVRVIYQRDPETGADIFLWVAKHDDAYKWVGDNQSEIADIIKGVLAETASIRENDKAVFLCDEQLSQRADWEDNGWSVITFDARLTK